MTIGGVLVVVVVGALYVVGLWKGKKDNADDRLINILKETVDALEEKVTKQGQEIEELTEEVAELRRDNKHYLDVLQGRDAQTQEFYKQSFESMKVSKETHALVTSLASTLEKLTEVLQAKQ